MLGAVRCALILVLASCRVGTTLDPGTAITCERPADCPSGWRCGGRGVCVREGAVEDLEPPRIVTAEARDPTSVLLTFSEAVAPGELADTGAYRIEPALLVNGVSVSAQSVRLVT